MEEKLLPNGPGILGKEIRMRGSILCFPTGQGIFFQGKCLKWIILVWSRSKIKMSSLCTLYLSATYLYSTANELYTQPFDAMQTSYNLRENKRTIKPLPHKAMIKVWRSKNTLFCHHWNRGEGWSTCSIYFVQDCSHSSSNLTSNHLGKIEKIYSVLIYLFQLFNLWPATRKLDCKHWLPWSHIGPKLKYT